MAEGPSDAELVRRVKDADGVALSQLYQRFVRPCYSLARRICADDRLAEDVVQEVFLTLWRDPTRFDPARGGFATWLLTVTHHRAVDAVRKETAIRRRIVAVPEAGEDWSPTPVPGADQAALARVAARCARHCIAYPSRSDRCSSCLPSRNDSDGKPNTPPPNSPRPGHHPAKTLRQSVIKPS